MKSEFEIAITQLCSDRNLAPEVILEAIEAALVAAYKRNYGADQNIGVTLDRHSGQAQVYVKKLVSEEAEDDDTQISLAEARTYDPQVNDGDFIDIELKPRNFGRIAAQTAKQVIMQRIREAERDSVYLEYSDRVGEIVNGVVRNVDSRSRNVMIGLGKAEALLPRSEQIPGEHYRYNQRLRVYITEVARTGHGPQIIVSRRHRDLLRRLLELEVPEIFNGVVEVKAIAREAGSRSKVAVAALQAGVDPVGSCVGMRGVRIQSVVNELDGEKIDVVAWAADMPGFVANALSPAQVLSVLLNEEEGTAKVIVPDRALSLAIGKEGQNARLAAKLTGWRIDIKGETEAAEEAEQLAAEAQEAELRAQELEAARQAAADLLAEAEAALGQEEAGLDVHLEAAPEGSIEAVDTAQEEEVELRVPEPDEPVSAEEPELATPESVGLEELESQLEAIEEQPSPADTSQELEVSKEELVVEAAAPGGFDEEEVPEPAEALEGAAEEESVAPVEYDADEREEEEGEEAEGEEGEEDAPEYRREKPRRKRPQRILEFDERLGRVVARRKRKPSRKRGWEESDEDWS